MEDETFNENEMLLVLSYAPDEEGKSIIDFCPFDGELTLNEIIGNYNKNCYKKYKDMWGKDYAKTR